MVSNNSDQPTRVTVWGISMLHDIIQSLDITRSVPAKENMPTKSMALLDLQGMKSPSQHKTDHGGNSDISLLLCD